MKDLIKRSYEAIKQRGLIKEDTHEYEFFDKIEEEFHEVDDAVNLYCSFMTKSDKDRYIEELTDLATVCIMQIHHLGYDFEKEFEKVVLKNEKRAKEKR